MAWYDCDKLTAGNFMKWLSQSDWCKGSVILVKAVLGTYYLFNDTKNAGNGSLNVLSGNQLGAHSNREKGALLAEIATMVFSKTGEAKAPHTLNLLPEARKMAMTIFNMSLNNYNYIDQNRNPANFENACTKAVNNNVDVNAVAAELKLLCAIADAFIQEWFDTWQAMQTEQASTSAQNALASLRRHQAMKFVGKSSKMVGHKGGHESGNFWLLTRAIDGRPVILISSKEKKAVDSGYTAVATGNGSVIGRVVTGTYVKENNNLDYTFTVTAGGKPGALEWFREQGKDKQSLFFVDALKATGVYGDKQGVNLIGYEHDQIDPTYKNIKVLC